RLSVDRVTVRRGDSITVTVEAPAASRATLWTRGPGEPWRAASLPLDSTGRAIRRLGPIEADLFLRASSGGRRSVERRVKVAVPAFVAALELTAHYPAYLVRTDEPLLAGLDTILVPEGTVILTSGAASVPLAAVAWQGKGGSGVSRLAVTGQRFSGRLRAEAWDNAPAPHVGRSAEIALRLPSLEELRAALRTATQGLVEAADSIADSQRDLGERTGDLAQQRSRDETTGARRPPGAQSGSLPFQATERAQAVAREQEALEQRVQELSKAVEEIARAAKAAGIDDTAFQARLREVQEMLQRAVTPELEQRLRELQEALAKLDPEAARQALQRLAEAQQQLKAELERSRELFRRAATEGALASLAADAEDLKRRQAEWNGTDARRPDSAAAARERALAERADSLAHGIEQVGKDLGPKLGSETLAAPQQAAHRAQAAMQRATESAGRSDAAGAQQAGEEAEQQLAELPGALRARRDSLARAWRQ